jgi:hypothetical protein
MHRTDIQGPTAAQRQQHETLHGNFINTSTAVADHLFSTLRRWVLPSSERRSDLRNLVECYKH